MQSLVVPLKRRGNYSPLRYPGGKARLGEFLHSTISKLECQPSYYAEPFAGGAGAALSLLYLERVKRIIINDLDPAVFAFWETAVKESSWLIDRIKNVDVTVEEWWKQRNIYLSGGSVNDLGFAFFFLNRVNRSGILNGWPIGGLNQTGDWKLDARYNKTGLVSRIEKLSLYSSRIEVRNEDALDISRELLEDDRGFVYLDPPYYKKGKVLYLNHYGEDDHKQLATCLNTHSESKWLLTYDHTPEITKLYSERSMTQFGLGYSAHTYKVGSEAMIMSDKISRSLGLSVGA